MSRNRLKSLEITRRDPVSSQNKLLYHLISRGEVTHFGRDHKFEKIDNIKAFRELVPLRDYNAFEPYIERARRGEERVLWDTPVKWFAKSSGTSSSKSKFIPVTYDSLNSCHFEGMKKMLSVYVDNNPASAIFDGDALTLGGSVSVDELGRGGSHYGDLSAILLSNSPFWVEMRRVPPKKVALIEDFETKVRQICKGSRSYNVTNFSGVPSWNLILLRRVLEYNNLSTLGEIWPNLELFMHGGINFEPYRDEYNRILIGTKTKFMENYNASEGYFAFQDNPFDSSMLLLTDNGVFFEFIPMSKLNEALSGNFRDFDTVESVKTGVNYAMVITTNGGLWRYLIGDCVTFTSLFPHKIIITGRTQLFINAFGEELMINNAERALAECCNAMGCSVANYTVAPIFMDNNRKGAHQWVVEFSAPPKSIEEFAALLDKNLCSINSDYEAKRRGDVTMLPLEITIVKPGCFYEWMRERGRLGGQNKVPRLSNSREHINELLLLNERL